VIQIGDHFSFLGLEAIAKFKQFFDIRIRAVAVGKQLFSLFWPDRVPFSNQCRKIYCGE
jgi:hypothetical protein